MAVAGRRNHPAAERRQLSLDPLAVRRQHLLDKRLVALRIAVARHLALQIHRADDVRKQKRLQFGHIATDARRTGHFSDQFLHLNLTSIIGLLRPRSTPGQERGAKS